jgi:hypothetical protein
VSKLRFPVIVFVICSLIFLFPVRKAQAAITYVDAGTGAYNATTNSQSINAPTLQADDIIIACIFQKSLSNAISPPDGTWTEIVQNENDTGVAGQDHTIAIYWKRASGGDSGAAFVFTKASDDNIVFGGVLLAYRGVDVITPIDATTESIFERTTQNDNVDFNDFNPTSTSIEIVLVAFHADDVVDFSTPPTGTNPTFAFRTESETNLGTDCAIAVSSGSSDGSAMGTRTWVSNSSANASSTGVAFALVTASGGPVTPTPRKRVIITKLDQRTPPQVARLAVSQPS